MHGLVIQGFFIGGAMPVHAVRRVSGGSPASARMVGAPAPAFAGSAGGVQARMATGRPALAHQNAGVAAQPHGGNGNFEIDPAQVGLNRGGGSPLPQAVLAKMEAAFGADFSAVRVHVGPQASRIGALAFTTGNDLYFAPGQFQPDSVRGQQLIGHELAHVIQQRQGRVRAPGNGVAVVQDRALEAEADRLGIRAAAMTVTPAALQRKSGPGGGPSTGRLPIVQPKPGTGTRAVSGMASRHIVQRWGWSDTFAWTADKLSKGPDLASSFRRQQMLVRSTWARQTAAHKGVKALNPAQIRLFHPTYTAPGSPTDQRRVKIAALLNKKMQSVQTARGRGFSVHLTKGDINGCIPSADDIQVAEDINGSRKSYLTLQGVGRLCAIKMAAQNFIQQHAGRGISIKITVDVDVYDVGSNYAGLLAISRDWYRVGNYGEEGIGEGLGWKMLGSLLSGATLTAAGYGLRAAIGAAAFYALS